MLRRTSTTRYNQFWFALRVLFIVVTLIRSDKLISQSFLRSLEVLDLFGCDVTKEKDYSKRVFELIPTLKVLDGFNQYVASGVLCAC